MGGMKNGFLELNSRNAAISFKRQTQAVDMSSSIVHICNVTMYFKIKLLKFVIEIFGKGYSQCYYSIVKLCVFFNLSVVRFGIVLFQNKNN